MVKSIEGEADKLFKKIGMTQGTVGDRMRKLGEDFYPNTDEAKEQLIRDLNEKAKWIEKQLPAYFGQLPKAPLEIRRVPKAIEAGAPGGYYNSPSLDGKRPGIYWINLRDTAEQPRFTLSTLTYHEAIPGHHLQLALNNEAGDLPLIRKMIGFSGYSEGWALYAEELAVEMGMYEDDPVGEIGMLHDAMFRAVRLVVDSGMHHKKWSREQAVKYMVDNIGDQEPRPSQRSSAMWSGPARPAATWSARSSFCACAPRRRRRSAASSTSASSTTSACCPAASRSRCWNGSSTGISPERSRVQRGSAGTCTKGTCPPIEGPQFRGHLPSSPTAHREAETAKAHRG